jgi:hypothetical protein
MTRASAVARRTPGVPGLGLAAVVSVIASHACVIADPPTDLPTLPELRPVIVRGSVVPSASSIVGRWPDKFIVPVELVDPSVRIFYSAFVDYNSATGEGIDGAPQTSDFELNSTNGRVRTLEVPITPPSLDRCHVVEVVVALRLKATTDPKNAHTPDEPGGDSVTWFYSPSGDLAGCPVLDAGITPLDLDAEAEGGPP